MATTTSFAQFDEMNKEEHVKLEQARHLFHRGHLKLALEKATSSCNRSYSPACYFTGVIKESLGQTENALSFYDYSCRLKYFQSCFRMAQIYSSQRRIKKAERYYHYVCELAQHSRSCFEQARIRLDQRKRISAQLLFDKACSMSNAYSRSCLYSFYTSWINGERFGQIRLTNKCVKEGKLEACVLAAQAHEIFKNEKSTYTFYQLADRKCRDHPQHICHKIANFYMKKGHKRQALLTYDHLCQRKDSISCELANSIRSFQTAGKSMLRIPASTSIPR